eukprot:5996557-Pyramimonas_sp.AAC.1
MTIFSIWPARSPCSSAPGLRANPRQTPRPRWLNRRLASRWGFPAESPLHAQAASQCPDVMHAAALWPTPV